MMDTVSTEAARTTSSDAAVNWQAVYGESLPKVFRYFSCWVGNRSLAEDLTSTTFEMAWTSREHFDERKGTPMNWLLGIARNVKSDYFRRTNPETGLDEADALVVNQTVEETAERHRDFDRLYRLLKQLDARQRELIALKYAAGRTNREIARLTGLTESNVGTILHRVVRRMRAQWEQSK